jgi:muramoyltetrapeptide carboxypeptidase
MNISMPILEKGDEMRIISTARKISEQELRKTLHYISSKGFKVSFGKHLFDTKDQFAGKDEDRLEDLQEAINSPSIKAIWLARGGYGTHRIISKLDISLLKKFPKWIIGYSDVTVLHSLLNSQSIPSLHATMPINFENQSTESFDNLFRILKGIMPQYTIPSHSFNQAGKATGILIGGNLSIIYSLTGTQLFEHFENSILFFEDLDEYLYHIDRMMMNLELSGVLGNLKGLIVGGLSNMNDNEIAFGKSAEEIVQEHISNYSIPVCFGFPAGHQFENYPLIVGKEINLDVNKERSLINY